MSYAYNSSIQDLVIAIKDNTAALRSSSPVISSAHIGRFEDILEQLGVELGPDDLRPYLGMSWDDAIQAISIGHFQSARAIEQIVYSYASSTLDSLSDLNEKISALSVMVSQIRGNQLSEMHFGSLVQCDDLEASEGQLNSVKNLCDLWRIIDKDSPEWRHSDAKMYLKMSGFISGDNKLVALPSSPHFQWRFRFSESANDVTDWTEFCRFRLFPSTTDAPTQRFDVYFDTELVIGRAHFLNQNRMPDKLEVSYWDVTNSQKDYTITMNTCVQLKFDPTLEEP